MSATRPKVLFVYYTYSQQTRRVVEAMTDVLRERGCEVEQARIEFTDPRYTDLFSQFPFRHAYLAVARMVSPQLRHATGEIRVPDIVREGGYDFVCIASPTNGTHFIAAGGPVGSMLALMGYLATGVVQDRYLGVKLPPPNLQPATPVRPGHSQANWRTVSAAKHGDKAYGIRSGFPVAGTICLRHQFPHYFSLVHNRPRRLVGDDRRNATSDRQRNLSPGV